MNLGRAGWAHLKLGIHTIDLGYIAQWLEWLTADQQVPGSNPGVPLRAGLRHGLINAKTFATKFGKANGHTGD